MRRAPFFRSKYTAVAEYTVCGVGFDVYSPPPPGGHVFISQEGPRFYPHLLKYVRIKLIEAR